MEHSSKLTIRVSLVTILINLLLSLGKLAAGLLARSGAMLSDAVHSLSDVFSTIVVIVGVKIASKASDREHPYGHERMECVAAVILSVILFMTGLALGYAGLERIARGEAASLPVPGAAALYAALLSILVKEGMFWYTRHYAHLTGSSALMADAWHHRSDALSSVGALLGIAGARLGYPILDCVASVVICVFILKAAVEIFQDAIDKMVDHSCSPETEERIRERILTHQGVCGIDLLLTREFGSRVYIELEVSVDGRLPLVEAHAIAQEIHDDIELTFPEVKHIMIHLNPAQL